MSSRKFIRDRIEKRELIDDLKNAILSGSEGRVRGFEKLGANSINDVLDLMISVGNTAYTTGEIDVFNYFIGSLFDIVNSNAEIDLDELLESIFQFGVMSTYSYDIYSYSIILENFVDYTCSLKEMETIEQNLHILKKLALESDKKGFDSGVLQVAVAFKDIADYLQKENMLLSRFFLKNHLISMIYTVDKKKKEDLKENIIREIGEILKDKPILAKKTSEKSQSELQQKTEVSPASKT
jgi:hypothetical protein